MKLIAVAFVLALVTVPLNAQEPLVLDAPMIMSAEQRARIVKEFADLHEEKESYRLRFYNCETAHFTGWREWW